MSRLPCALVMLFLVYPPLSGTAIGQDYLIREELQLPTDGKAVRTQKPLEPYRVHRIVVSSPYDLSAIQSGGASLLFDGETLPLEDYATGLYGVVNHLFYLTQGKGRPLDIRLNEGEGTDPLRQKTLGIAVKVFRYHWWESRHGHFPHPLLGVGGGIVAGVAVILVSFRYCAPERYRRFVQLCQSVREEVVQHFRPLEPVVRVVERPRVRRPEPPPIRIIHHGDTGANNENDRD